MGKKSERGSVWLILLLIICVVMIIAFADGIAASLVIDVKGPEGIQGIVDGITHLIQKGIVK